MKFKRMLQKYFTGYFIYELFNKLHTTEAVLEVIMYLFMVGDLIFKEALKALRSIWIFVLDSIWNLHLSLLGLTSSSFHFYVGAIL